MVRVSEVTSRQEKGTCDPSYSNKEQNMINKRQGREIGLIAEDSHTD